MKIYKRVCLVCNKEFTTKISYKIYCSGFCNLENQRKKSLNVSSQLRQIHDRMVDTENQELQIAFNSLHYGLDRLESILIRRTTRSIRYGRPHIKQYTPTKEVD